MTSTSMCTSCGALEAEVHTSGCEYVKSGIAKSKPVEDKINHPRHYTSHPSKVECIQITEHMGFNLGNVVKYVWRDGLKDAEAPLADLKKARWYLDREIARREESAK